MIPVSSNQDTVGPMCRNVSDAASILSVIAGPDPLDPITFNQPTEIPDYKQALVKEGLQGIRIGVPRLFRESPPDENITKAFNAALETMKELGAIIIDPADFPNAHELRANLRTREMLVMETDFKVNRYLVMWEKWQKK